MNKRRSKGAAIAAAALGLAALAFFAPRGVLPWAPRGVSPAEETGGETPSSRVAVVAVVTVDGAVWDILPLSAAARAVFTVKTPRGQNRIVLHGGTVAVEDADCPNRLCQKQGAISRPGEVIACLPHRLLIEVREAP